MELNEALYTTRAMRRVKPDPISNDVVARILDAAVRAPSGGNQQRWRFLLVTDAERKAKLQQWYRTGLDELNATQYKATQDMITNGDPNDPVVAQAKRTNASAQWLADNLHKVPLIVLAFGKPNGESSLYPALWSAQLAARAEGIGTALTTLLFKYYRDEVYELFGVPDDGEWVGMAMLTMGYPTGRWGVAQREPAHTAAFQEHWDRPVTWTADKPLWG
jgi:nitroreductase